MKKGFTLIELLVVVLIIGILSSIALPQYVKAVEKARATEAIQLLGDLARAQRIYQMSTGGYANDLNMLDVELPGISTGNAAVAQTRNFRITITSADNAATFTANAQRWNSSTNAAATGDQQYGIKVSLDANGTLTRCCNKTVTSAACSTAATEVTSMCKSIANNANGTIK